MTATSVLWGPARIYGQMGAPARSRMGQASVSPEVASAFDALGDLAEKIRYERALDAADFRDYSAAGAERLTAVDALGKAERTLLEQQTVWEKTHRNADAMAAAQAQVESLQLRIQEAAAKAADLRLRVDYHAERIGTFRDKATRIIAGLPAEMQLQGRKIIDPCAQTAAMQGARSAHHPAAALAPRNPMAHPSRPQEVRLMGPGSYRPAPALLPRGNRLGQLVNVNPSVAVNIQTGIEKFLFPVGLMAAGGASFVVGTVIPPSLKVVTTLSGLGLIGWGVYALIKGGPGGSGSSSPAATPHPPTGATPLEASPQPFIPPSAPALGQIQIEMVSPLSGDKLSSIGTFLGIGTPKMPVLLRFYNPTRESLTFNLEFEWDEFAAVGDFNRDPKHGTQAFQVTVGPGEEKNQQFDLVIKTSGWSSSVDVALSLYKKRVPNENRILAMTRTFTVV